MAIVWVLLYHAGFSRFSGALFGVSAFFALSGYLVVSLLLGEHRRSGKIKLVSFWERRLRRLLPAALVAVLVCLAIGIALDADPHELRWDALSSATFWTNWLFIARDKAYGALFSTPSTFEHFWSIAIEAQLYLVVALALVCTRGKRLATAVVLGIGVAVSSGAMWFAYQTSGDNSYAYYGTLPRASEFLVGGLLAVALANGAARRKLGVGAGLIALVALVVHMAGVLVATVEDPWVYRGGLLANAVIVVVMIWAVTGAAPIISPLLAWRPLAWLGMMSYGVYLFHWPAFVLLTSRRTGLDRVPLFAVRLAVTMALALLSYHFVERGVRHGALRRWWVAAPSMLAVVVAVVVVSTAVAPVPTPELASADGQPSGADASAPAAPKVVESAPDASDDGVFTVTVVGDDGGRNIAARIAQRQDGAVTFSGIEPVGCAAPCAPWSQRWAHQVEKTRADLLLVALSSFDQATFEAGLGSPMTADPRAWVGAGATALAQQLAATGTTVVWLPAPDPSGNGIARMVDPGFAAFYRGFEDAFAVAGPTVRHLDVRTQYAELVDESGRPGDFDAAVADLAGPRLAAIAQSTVLGIPRVAIVGDSVARSLGGGLEPWAVDTGSAAVWTLARDGCGLWLDGEIRSLYGGVGPLPPDCFAAADRWRRDVADFRPDVVLVLTTIWDLSDRKLPGWPDMAQPGDRRFDDAMVDRFVGVVDELSSGGAQVVWLTTPCADVTDGDLPFGTPKTRSAFEPARTEHLNGEILPRVAAARPGQVRIEDLYGLACPDGQFTRELGGSDDARPDGLHFSDRTARWLADQHAARWIGPA